MAAAVALSLQSPLLALLGLPCRASLEPLDVSCTWSGRGDVRVFNMRVCMCKRSYSVTGSLAPSPLPCSIPHTWAEESTSEAALA